MKIVKYIVSVFLVIGSVGMISNGEVTPALFLVVLGVIIFPQVNSSLKSNYQKFKIKGIRYTLYIVLFLLSSIFMNKESLDSINLDRNTETVKIKKQKGLVEVKELESQKINRIIGNDNFWKLYDPQLKVRVYKLIIAKDCNGLQNEFNIAERNSRANQKRIGTSNAYLMDFINSKMGKIGCYK